MRLDRRAALAGLVGAGASLAVGDARAKPRDLPPEPVDVTVTARRLSAFKPGVAGGRHGALEWVGGIELRAPDPAFGGLSGLALDPTGRRLLAISDAGIWLEGTLETEREAPTALRDARLCPMRGVDGSLLAGRPSGDAEALAVRDGIAHVAFENVQRVLAYPRARGLTATPTRVELPADVRQLRHSSGIEAMTFFARAGAHRGALLVFGEDPVRGESDIRGWIVDGPLAGRFSLDPDGYSATDAATLPDGDIVLLERRVRLPFGIWMRVRHLRAADIRPGARVGGRVLVEAGLDHAIDNMEGIAVHVAPDGTTMLTMVSDDNFSVLQRTLLLRFRLVG